MSAVSPGVLEPQFVQLVVPSARLDEDGVGVGQHGVKHPREVDRKVAALLATKGGQSGAGGATASVPTHRTM